VPPPTAAPWLLAVYASRKPSIHAVSETVTCSPGRRRRAARSQIPTPHGTTRAVAGSHGELPPQGTRDERKRSVDADSARCRGAPPTPLRAGLRLCVTPGEPLAAITCPAHFVTHLAA
jgi:hypothetical protein